MVEFFRSLIVWKLIRPMVPNVIKRKIMYKDTFPLPAITIALCDLLPSFSLAIAINYLFIKYMIFYLHIDFEMKLAMNILE
jgi:hypothetical protein